MSMTKEELRPEEGKPEELVREWEAHGLNAEDYLREVLASVWRQGAMKGYAGARGRVRVVGTDLQEILDQNPFSQ